MIKNMGLYAHGLGFRHVWIELSCPNNTNILFFLFFESVSLYIVVISRVQIFCPIFPAPLYTPLIKTCYVFSNVYIHSPSFIKNNF